MIIHNISVSNVLNAIVPISRFNRGEANKIFDEVSQNGFKIVVKNNNPTCVLLTPERYEELVSAAEDYALLLEAQSRMKDTKEDDFVSSADVQRKLGITNEELDNAGVEIDE